MRDVVAVLVDEAGLEHAALGLQDADHGLDFVDQLVSLEQGREGPQTVGGTGRDGGVRQYRVVDFAGLIVVVRRAHRRDRRARTKWRAAPVARRWLLRQSTRRDGVEATVDLYQTRPK